MSTPQNKITFSIFYDDQEFQIQTYGREYRNLKDLIQDKVYPDNFGECGGMGRCATCMVEIEGLEGEAALMKRNEVTSLERAGKAKAAVRLSCQIEIDDNLSNTHVRVLEII